MTVESPIRFFPMMDRDAEAYFFTLLRTTFGLAAIIIDDRYTRYFVGHDGKE